MLKIDKNGWISNENITKAPRPVIEHGPIASIKAIVLHRTGTINATSVLNAWKTKKEGTHFLISETGQIYQTASLKKQCWHVGKLYAKCKALSICKPEEAQIIEDILHRKNINWGTKFRLVTRHELKKDYPVRYPHNLDSLGIEVVCVISKEMEIYELPNKQQQGALFRLVDELISTYGLSVEHIYAHGKIAHKDIKKSEGAMSLKAYKLYKAG